MQPSDDLVIQVFFWTSAFLAAVEAMKASGWRVWAFAALGAVLFLCGALWHWLKEIYPPFTAWVTTIATSPQSWFLLLVIFIVLVSVTGRAKRRPQSDGSSEFTALNNALKGLFERVGNIEQLPASPTAEDHDNLRTTVVSLMKRHSALGEKSTELMNEVKGRLDSLERSAANSAPHPQTARDILLLMHFTVYQSTVLMLDDLLNFAPDGIVEGPLQLGGDFVLKNAAAHEFIERVRRKLDPGSWRRSDFENVMRMAEADAERQLEQTPVDQRPGDVDHLALRRWTIVHLQCARGIDFLRRQKLEAEENLRNQRFNLLQRYTEQNKS
jgi:hypothetical protein